MSEHEFLFANRTICVARSITFQLAFLMFGNKTIWELGLRECAEFVGNGNEKIIRGCRAFPHPFSHAFIVDNTDVLGISALPHLLLDDSLRVRTTFLLCDASFNVIPSTVLVGKVASDTVNSAQCTPLLDSTIHGHILVYFSYIL